MAEDSSTDETGCKGKVVDRGTRAKEPKGTEPTAEVAAASGVPETGRPKEGMTGSTSTAQVVVTMIDLMTGSRPTKVRHCPKLGREFPCTLKQNTQREGEAAEVKV